MTTQTQNPMTAMFEQLNDNFSKTIKASMEFQEQTTRFWKDLFEQGGTSCRQEFEKVGGEMLPFSKANIERFQRMFDQQADRSVEFLHETFEVGKADSPAVLCDELVKLWKQSFDTVRQSNEAFAHANAEMFQQFSRFAQSQGVRQETKPAAKVAK